MHDKQLCDEDDLHSAHVTSHSEQLDDSVSKYVPDSQLEFSLRIQVFSFKVNLNLSSSSLHEKQNESE